MNERRQRTEASLELPLYRLRTAVALLPDLNDLLQAGSSASGVDPAQGADYSQLDELRAGEDHFETQGATVVEARLTPQP